ncbi:ExbD/TolR family protein [Noviherbaspirillum sp. ST9]|uniref:ExbD/TolR family protein n=1 Tax=Noviherbaspirillum sp. ST9 TaxID=3401606 RepID=UPI003B585C5A
MRSWGESKRARARIEIIPMIDVMMFLLIFFVLISINVIPTLGVRTQLPKSSQVQELNTPVRVVITIAKEGELLLDGRLVTLEEIPKRLREKQGEDLKKPSVLVNGDESVRLQRLLDVLDVVKASGFDSLSIAARRK